MKRSKIKSRLMMFLCRILYNPEITFEDEAIQGRELREPCVVICNHIHFLDGPMLQYAFKCKNLCSLMAKDQLDKPFMKPLVSGCMCIPVDRKKATMSWLRDCQAEIKNGNSVIIFAEGKAIKEKEIEDFKSGFALLAKSTGVKVLPTALYGEWHLFSRNRVKIKIGTMTELQAQGGSAKALENEARRFQDIVTEMYEGLKSSTK